MVTPAESAEVESAMTAADGLSGRAERVPKLANRKCSRVVGVNVLVNDISIQVATGEVLAVVGPSGAGKSSFLGLLNRLDEPTAGTVLLDNQDYKTIQPRELRRRGGM